MKVIASMTTIPSRIGNIRPVIECILAQTVSIDRLEINIPEFCIRTGEAYSIPDWLTSLDRVDIFRTPDYGSTTKIAPTLLRHPDVCLWSVDDDCNYPPNQLERLIRYSTPEDIRILARHGGIWNQGRIQWMRGHREIDVFEGFGGVIYPPNCIQDDFQTYIEVTAQNSDCRKSDDVVLSYYFKTHGVKLHMYNDPNIDGPSFPSSWQPYYTAPDSLHRQDGGHNGRYLRVYRFLESLTY